MLEVRGRAQLGDERAGADGAHLEDAEQGRGLGADGHERGDPLLDIGLLLAHELPAGEEIADLEPPLLGGVGKADGFPGRSEQRLDAVGAHVAARGGVDVRAHRAWRGGQDVAGQRPALETRDSATYSPWSSASGPRQIVLAYDASGDTSRLVPFTLEVRNQYTEGPQSATIYDTLMVVNRVGSEFGAGWWLAGVEQLVLNQPGNKILWLGGDGSAAVYRPVNGTTWVRASGAFRDTLVLASGVYTRTVRHGVQVKFDNAGRHIQTVNRTGQTTTFTWAGSPARLTGIRVPPGASGPTYTLAYDGSNKLDYISDPATRVLNATVSGGSLTQLTDPDTHGVSFGYDGARRMTSRTGRRGFATSYTYANALRVTAVRVPLTATDTAVTALEWWDEKGLIVGTPGGTFYSADTLNTFSKVYGARVGVDDNATFWVDRWGAPVRAVGAAHDTTILTRDAATGLVTRMRSPVGQILLMTYDARGSLLTLQDSTFDASGSGTVVSTTRYHYAPGTPDSPDSIIDPSGVVTRYEYNTLGLLSRAFSVSSLNSVPLFL